MPVCLKKSKKCVRFVTSLSSKIQRVNFPANSHIPCRALAVPRHANSHIPCRALAVPRHANSHMPCRAPAVLRQRRVLRKNQRATGKIRTANRGIPHGSQKTTKSGHFANRPSVDINSHIPFCVHAMPLPCYAMALRSPLQSWMVVAQQGHGMVCV